MNRRVSTYIKYKEIIINIMINKESICYYLLKVIKYIFNLKRVQLVTSKRVPKLIIINY